MTNTYDNCVVLKPWGHEFQVFDNGKCSIWMLCIKPGCGTSVHCHFGKEATFKPLAGYAVVRTNSLAHLMNYPCVLTVSRYEFHAVGNAGTEDLWLLEIEKPSGKADLFRLRDGYGRGQGYEGGDSIVRGNLDRYGYFSLAPSGLIVNQFGHVLQVSADETVLHVGDTRCTLSDPISEAA